MVDYTGVNASTRGVLTVTGTDPSNLTIEFNHFQGWTGAVYLQGTLDAALPLRTGGHTINGNVAEMNTVGFSNDAVENTEFTNNVVLSDGAGEEAFGFAQAGTGIVINNNDIANQRLRRPGCSELDHRRREQLVGSGFRSHQRR